MVDWQCPVNNKLGLEEIWEQFVATKVDKKSLLKIWAEKKFVDGIDEKYVDQNKPANGNVRNKEGIRQNLIFPFFNETQKKLVWSSPPLKKFLESLQPTKTLASPPPPPPDI